MAGSFTLNALLKAPTKSNKKIRSIWFLALGYFAFYIPYSTLIKVFTKGLLPGIDGSISGLELLPSTAIATTVTLLLAITFMGKQHPITGKGKHLFGSLPTPRPQTMVSGIATAVIIATTTLNYSFAGISILFALLLMRGGVLILAPIMDGIFKRQIRWNSITALVLSFIAISVSLADVDNYVMTLWAVINISGYLGGYIIRLYSITELAKSEQPNQNWRYFLEETLVAAVTLTTIPLLLALLGWGQGMMLLRTGFSDVLFSQHALPGLCIGFLYSCLYFFGSHIYLHPRENTFSIPLNRCSSLMSGVVASFGLTVFLGLTPPSSQQMLAVTIIGIALCTLGAPDLYGKLQSRITTYLRQSEERLYLFVCERNTTLSPMAEAFCRHEMDRLKQEEPNFNLVPSIQAQSASLMTHPPNRPINNLASQSLVALGLGDYSHHRSNPITPEQVQKAHSIWCMTSQQCEALVDRFPQAKDKIHCLSDREDIFHPNEFTIDECVTAARKIQSWVQHRLLQTIRGEVS